MTAATSQIGIYFALGSPAQVASPAKSNVVRFGMYDFAPHTQELHKEGMRVRLEGQPVAILKMLLNRPGELVTREELQKTLWPADTFVDFEHSLNAAIKRLRAALNDSADAPRYVETVARRGYRWVAPVTSASTPVNESNVLSPNLHAPPLRLVISTSLTRWKFVS